MEALKEIEKIVNTLSLNINSLYSGLYYDEEVVFYKSLDKNKGQIISELLSLLVRKFAQSSDIIGSPQYLFTEGKQYAIFLYNAGEKLTLASIVEGKPNFSLVRLEHDKASKSLQGVAKQIPAILEQIKEKFSDKEEITEKTTTIEEQIDDTSVQVKEPIEDDIKELEEIFSSNLETESEVSQELKEKKEEDLEKEEEGLEEVKTLNDTEEENEKEQVLADNIEEDAPSLEEILLSEEALSEVLEPKILEEIKRKFIEEIGPVGKLLFNKNIKNLNIDVEKPYKHKVEELVSKLSEEITVESRKDDFVKYCQNLLKD